MIVAVQLGRSGEYSNSAVAKESKECAYGSKGCNAGE
jgi:hypothetical protein